MKTIENLKIKMESFLDLQKGWDSYDSDEISIKSIMTAHKVLDTLPKFIDINSVDVFPMRDGGVQIEIDDFKEIEILDSIITEIQFDNNQNIIKKYIYELN